MGSCTSSTAFVGVNNNGQALNEKYYCEPINMKSQRRRRYATLYIDLDDDAVSSTDEANAMRSDRKSSSQPAQSAWQCNDDGVCARTSKLAAISPDDLIAGIPHIVESSDKNDGIDNGNIIENASSLYKRITSARRLMSHLTKLPSIDLTDPNAATVIGEFMDALGSTFPSLTLVPSYVNLTKTCPDLDVPLLKPVPFDIAVTLIKPLDLYATRTATMLGNIINIIQQRTRKCDFCTHVGVFINTDVVQLPGMVPGEWYILESVLVGTNGSPVIDISGQNINGVQIRRFRDVFTSTDGALQSGSESTCISMWGSLNTECRAAVDRILYAKHHDIHSHNRRSDMADFVTTSIGTAYPSNIVNFLSSILHGSVVKMFASPDGSSYFCSEFVTKLYHLCGILDAEVFKHNPRNVFPVDFAGKIGKECLQSMRVIQ